MTSFRDMHNADQTDADSHLVVDVLDAIVDIVA